MISLVPVYNTLTGQTVELSRTFGNCGSVSNPYTSADVTQNRHTLIKPNGRILTGGHVVLNFSFSYDITSFFYQYHPDGSPDASFGINGKAAISLNTRTICENFTLQPDGKIIGVGTDAPDNGGASHLPLIFRLNENGTIDNSFGSGGKTVERFDAVSSGSFTKVIVLPDGKILAAGASSGNSNGGVYGPAIMKFNADGSLDNSFGNIPGFPGRARINPANNANVDLFVQNDGKIILTYTRDVYNNGNAIVLEAVRFLQNGTVDVDFGSNGTLQTSQSGSTQRVVRSAVQPDGKYLFSMTMNNNANPAIPNRIVVVRYRQDFTPDPAFGTDGRVDLDNIDGSGLSFLSNTIGLQPDEKILIGGFRNSGYPSRLIVRLNSNGQVDASFNNTGYYFTPNYFEPNPDLIDIVAVNNDSYIVSSIWNFRLIKLTTIPETPTAGALNFDGGDDEVELGNWFNYEDFSIEMWVKPGALQNFYANLIDNAHADYVAWGVEQDGSNNLNSYYFSVSDDLGGARYVYFTLTPDTWQHIALIKDAASISVYINGVLAGSDIHTGNVIYDGSQFLRLCQWFNGDRAWKGSMDEVRFWNRPLTQSEIQNRMSCELPPVQTDLLAYYKFNQGFSTCYNAGVNSLTDLSGNNHSGNLLNFTLNGTSSNWVEGNVTGVCGGLITYYQDLDGDGFGNAAITLQAITQPAGYVTNDTDCNDDPQSGGTNIYPGATETCNGIDDDCDGQTDEGVTTTFYQDADGDGYGNATVTIQTCAAPAGYVDNNTDCNDDPASGGAGINPAATETCNGFDDDCDGLIDEGVTITFYRDADGDGFGNTALTTQACAAPAGYVTDNTDCNDDPGTEGAGIYPGATETCNGVDDNCNGQIDEGVTITFYRDADGDGFGNTSLTTQACAAPAGYVIDNTDCNDDPGAGGAGIYPGATETCNGMDDNCNGQIDEGVTTTFYQDADGDGFGNTAVTTQGCAAPAGYVTDNTDCNDDPGAGGAGIYPGATETCNGVDDNCNGQIDEGVTTTFYQDADGDGFGNAALTTQACTAPAGYVTDNTDCNDDPVAGGAGINPAATEICNGVDDDCDGQIDEGVTTTFYRDADGDGFGNTAVSTQACAAPAGYVTDNTDCNDDAGLGGAGIYPGAIETCNGIDDDCDGQIDEGVTITFYRDADSDGFGDAAVTTQACAAPAGYVSNSTDCDDTKALVYPGATEVCNGFDDDCDGLTDEGVTITFYQDADGDGYGNAAVTIQACFAPGHVTNSTDCDDTRAGVHPGAIEVCNGYDDDCDGLIDEGVQSTFYRDADGDGYGKLTVTTTACTAPTGYVTNSTDCDDSKASVYPGAIEVCGNNMDDNCNGTTDEGCSTLPVITINNASVFESQGRVTIKVILSKTSTQTVKVNYTTVDGTAVSSGREIDYLAIKGTLSIPPGRLSASIIILIFKDNIVEPIEYFTVRLSKPVNATFGNRTSLVSIRNGTGIPTSSVTVSKTINSTFADSEVLDELNVQAAPNPSSNYFTVSTQSRNTQMLQVKVVDISGRIIETRSNITANSRFKLGQRYLPGIYIIEVVQNNKRKHVKVIKH